MEVSDRSLPSCLRRLRRSGGLSDIFADVQLSRSIESAKVIMGLLSAICTSNVPANQQTVRSSNGHINDDLGGKNRLARLSSAASKEKQQ